MKHGKRPTVKQKQLISQAELNPNDWLITKNLPDAMYLQHRSTGQQRIIKH